VKAGRIGGGRPVAGAVPPDGSDAGSEIPAVAAAVAASATATATAIVRRRRTAARLEPISP
jgi:hypothetical protein